MPRPKSSGTGTKLYTPKRARAVATRRRRSAVAGKDVVMAGDISRHLVRVKNATRHAVPRRTSARAGQTVRSAIARNILASNFSHRNCCDAQKVNGRIRGGNTNRA